MKFLILFLIFATAACVIEGRQVGRNVENSVSEETSEDFDNTRKHQVHIGSAGHTTIKNRRYRIPVVLPVNVVNELLRGIIPIFDSKEVGKVRHHRKLAGKGKVHVYHANNALIHNRSDEDSEDDSLGIPVSEDERRGRHIEHNLATTREEGRGEVRRHRTLIGKGRVHVNHANDVLIHNESNEASDEDSRYRAATREVRRGDVRRGRNNRRHIVDIDSLENGEIYNRNRN